MLLIKDKKSVIKSAIGKVTNAVGGAMALPWTIAGKRKEKQSGDDAATLRAARQIPKSAPSFDLKGNPTTANLYRTKVEEIRARLSPKKK